MNGCRWLAALALLCAAAAEAAADRPPIAFLTGPDPRDPLEIALDCTRAERAERGRPQHDLSEFVVRDRSVTRRTGTTHLVLRQQIDDIEVWNGEISVHVARDGRVIDLHDDFAPRERRAAARVDPALDAAEAVQRAAAQLGLPGPAGLVELSPPQGPARETRLSDGGIARGPIPARLMWLSQPEGLRLVWNLQLFERGRPHAWDLCVDAENGALLAQADWVSADSYRAFGLPSRNAADGSHDVLADPADPLAAPLAWHDTNGVAGPEFSDTRGNNAHVQEDQDADDEAGAAPFRPGGGATNDFDFPFDPTFGPNSNMSAAIVNAFYWTNLLHDIHYRYGFDEAAGNFQQNNYGLGGQQLDPVRVDVQDGIGLDNAFFFTPPDGSGSFEPRMELLLFSNRAANLRVVMPVDLASSLPTGHAYFGRMLDPTELEGTLVRAVDPVEAVPDSTGRDACSPLTNAAAVSGNIALIDRGNCDFVVKVANAEAAGATAVVIANHLGENVINMIANGGTPPVTIPSVFIGQTNGAILGGRLDLGEDVDVALSATGTLRDSALSNGTIVHEYGHGVTERLTGGPSNSSCLNAVQSSGMSEGWSDFHEIALLTKSTGTRDDARPVGTYLLGEPPDGPGIRNFPYSTDLAVNPQTFEDIATTNQPHGSGEIWAVALWEMFWNLVDAHGFDPDVAGGSGGNNLALSFVMEGLKLQPCNPSFLDARDAILLAEMVETGGANACEIWDAFAKRGLGVSAASGSASSLAVVEAFDVPPACVPEPAAALQGLAALSVLSALARRSRAHGSMT